MTGPRVLPEYAGGNMGAGIAQAFMQRDQLNRQKDQDAVNTGVGLQPMTQDEAQNPTPSGFMHTVRGAIASVQGKQNPDDVQYAQNTMAQHPMQVGVTPSSDQPDGFSAAQPKTPGAFNAMTGGFGPSIARYAKLPSGQTVDMAYTPFGEKLQQAMMSHEYAMAISGQRVGAQRDIAAGHDATRVQTTGMNVDGRLQGIDQKANDQANIVIPAQAQGRVAAARQILPIQQQLKASPSGARIGGNGTAGPNPVTNLAHQGVMVANQIRNTNQTIGADQKVLSNGLYSHSTPADSANYNNAAAEIPRLKTTRDSLNGVYGGLAAKMQGTTQTPVQAKPTITKAEFQALRAKGHADADILGHYSVANQ